MAINYKKYEFRCYDYIRRMEALLQADTSKSQPQKWLKDTERLRADLESKRFRVAVVGEFDRGKTSFVNALLGKEILPVDCMPTTAAFNRITYGDTPSAYVVLKNGQKKSVEITELAGYITKLSASGIENATKIDEAVVQFPSLFCRNGVDLIDTPGMNDEEAMNQVTVSRLQNIDLAIIAIDASMPFSMTECAFTVQLLESPQVCQIILAITKIDTIRRHEQQKLVDFVAGRVREDVKGQLEQRYAPNDPIMQKYHVIFDKLCIFAVSSLDALDALARNDMELFERSGFRRLNGELPQIIMSSQNRNVIFNSERALRDIIEQYRNCILSRLEERKLAMPQLQKAKRAVVNLSKEYVSRAYPSQEQEMAVRFLPNPDKVHAEVRRHFIQALSRMQTLDYDELQAAFFPVIRENFQALNNSFHASETKLLAKQQTALMEMGTELQRQINSLFVSILPDFSFPLDALSVLPDAFRLMETDTSEQFYWVHSPLPDIQNLGRDWQVMPFVDAAIRESLQSYCVRRRQELSQIFMESKHHLEDMLQRIIPQFVGKIDQYMEWLAEDTGEQSILEALERLENDCRTMREQFQAEL